MGSGGRDSFNWKWKDFQLFKFPYLSWKYPEYHFIFVERSWSLIQDVQERISRIYRAASFPKCSIFEILRFPRVIVFSIAFALRLEILWNVRSNYADAKSKLRASKGRWQFQLSPKNHEIDVWGTLIRQNWIGVLPREAESCYLHSGFFFRFSTKATNACNTFHFSPFL